MPCFGKKEVTFVRRRKVNFSRVRKEPPRFEGARRQRRLHRWMVFLLVLICLLLAAAVFLALRQMRPAGEGAASAPSVSSLAAESEGAAGQAQLPVPDNSWALVVVSPNAPASGSLQPQLTDFEGVQVDGRIVPALQALLDDAKARGYTLALSAGYVSAEDQEALYQQRVQALIQQAGNTRAVAESTASQEVARGGYGDAQTGLSVDFSGGDDFLNSDAYHWLSNHCVDYGFVLRYADEKESLTGLAGNPLHFRYVGTRNAQQMRRLGMCLEEYVNYLSQQGSS